MKRQILDCFAPMVALALLGCSASTPAGNPRSGGSGGGSSNTGGSGGSQQSAGSGGNSPGGSGGSGGGTSATGGTSGGGGTTPAATGGSGGGADASVDSPPAVLGKACPGTMGTNTANLTVTRMDVSARRFMGGGMNMYRIDHDPMSGDIVIMTMGGTFFKLDPAAGTTTAYATGYPGGSTKGMAFGPDGTLYVLSVAGNYSATLHKGVGTGATKTWSVVATTAPYPVPSGTNFNHNYAGVAVSPDNKFIYFASGSRSDHGEVVAGAREAPLTSAILKVPVTATNVMIPNDETMMKPYLFADGLRNTFDMAFNADGELIGGDNGPDIDFPDEVNHLQDGKHYGFPWRFGAEDNPNMDATYTPAGDKRLHMGLMAVNLGTYKYEADYPAKPANVTFVDPIANLGPDGDKFILGKNGTVQDGSMMNMPVRGVSAHRSPSGISFDTKGVLCGDYFKAGFLLSYGAVQDVMGDRGEDLLMLQLTKNGSGQYEMKTTQLAIGIKTPIDSVMVDNKLYTISLYSNVMYEFTFPKPAP